MSEEREKFVDEVLEKALANYSRAEPRLGLEARVLARLEAEKASPARAWWWKWSWVPAAAALLIVGGLYLARPKPQVTPVVAEKPAPPVMTTATKQEVPVVRPAAQTKPRVRPSAQAVTKLAEAAKQPQFPAPQAPSEQEKLLLAYVRLQPQAAVQQAQASAQPMADIKIQPLDIPPLNPDGNQQVPER